MRLLGTGLLTELLEREELNNPKQGKALREALKTWKAEVKAAAWTKPTDIKKQFRTADHVGNNRMVFNICGNKYRLVVRFNYTVPVARVRFAGTHREYDDIVDIKAI